MVTFVQSQYRVLFAFHWHTSWRLIRAAEKLDPDAIRILPSEGRRSIHDLLFHLLNTDRGWRLALETGQQQPPLHRQDFPDLDALIKGFEREQSAMAAYLDRASSDEIEGEVHISSRWGESDLARWRILQHLVLHGMQHHAELAELVTERGQSPGDLDFIFYEDPA